MPSENTIYFYPGRGGHSHNGNDSSFIDTSVYSLFDFSWGEVGDPDRRASQRINYNAFRDFVITTVNGSILEPSGLVLQPGMVNGTAHIISRSIEADTIAANTITSNEIAANFVLVNTIIASSDFNGTFNPTTFALSNTGTDGWAITSAGDAVFTNGLFRGNLFVGNNDYWYSNGAFALGGNTGIYRNVGEGITLGANVTILGGLVATSVATPGIDIDSAGNLTANTFALYGNGAIVTSSGNFAVDAGGNLYAENANIAGTINSTNGSIGGFNLNIHDIDGGGILLHTSSGPGDPSYLIAQEDIGQLAAIYSDGTIVVQNGAYGAEQVMDGVSYYVSDSIGRTLSMTGSGITSNLYGEILSSSQGAYKLNGYEANNDEGDGGSIPIRSGDGSVRAQYFVMAGGVTGSGSTIIKRSDGYILVQSSRRDLKTNIEDISDSLNKIAALRPRIFNWKPQDDDPDDLFHREIKPNHKTMGFVVEEVADVSPEYLEYSIKDDELDAHYWKPNDFIALAIQGIKDLTAKVTQLEARIAEMEG